MLRKLYLNKADVLKKQIWSYDSGCCVVPTRSWLWGQGTHSASCWESWLTPSLRVPPRTVLRQRELPVSKDWKMQEGVQRPGLFAPSGES